MLEIILNYVYECLGERSPGVPYLLKATIVIGRHDKYRLVNMDIVLKEQLIFTEFTVVLDFYFLPQSLKCLSGN
jgi:hypothetical protein